MMRTYFIAVLFGFDLSEVRQTSLFSMSIVC